MTSKLRTIAIRAGTMLAVLVALVAGTIAASAWLGDAPAAAGQRAMPIQPRPAPVAAKQEAVAAKREAVAPVAVPAETGYIVKRVLTIDGPFRHGDYKWDDDNVPPGKIVVTVDLKAQTLSVFRGGYEIGTAVILYGGDDKPTPLGVFPVTQKDADHISNLYDAPMPYMLRLTNDGVAIHGSEVNTGFMTHGCVGVPTKFAKLLFAQVKLGDPVIITNGEMLSLGARIKPA